MAYVVDRVVICDAFREPDQHYQLLAGGRSRLRKGRRPSMRFLASARDAKGGIAGVFGKEAGLFEDLLDCSSPEQRNDFINQLRDEVRAWRERRLSGHGHGDAATARVVVRARRGAPGDRRSASFSVSRRRLRPLSISTKCRAGARCPRPVISCATRSSSRPAPARPW